jgi:hypothetical protein
MLLVAIFYKMWDGGQSTGSEITNTIITSSGNEEVAVKELTRMGAYGIESSSPFVMNKKW